MRVVAVLFLFLGRARPAFIVALAIPLSMLFAFSGMLRFGIAASLLSLGAIDFGLVVDSSVVMVENCVRHLAHDRENFSMKELAESIHRGLGLNGEVSSVSLKNARRFVPAAERLTLSHALACEHARALGWKPSPDSIMKEVEQFAREDAFLSHVNAPRTECKEK